MSNNSVISGNSAAGHSAEETLSLLGLTEVSGQKIVAPVILRTLEQVEAIENLWHKLNQTSHEPLTHFQSYDWCVNWMKYCHDPKTQEVAIVPLWKEGSLAAILPLMITKEPGGCRVMRFLGEPLIEYSNVLIDKNQISAEELVTVWDTVKNSLDVDAFIFKNFPACSYIFNIFKPQKISRSASKSSSIMDLTRLESWDSFRSGMSRSARRSRNKRRKKLEAIGPVTYRVFEGGTEEYKNIVERSKIMKKEWLRETGRNAGELFSGNTIDAITHMSGDLEEMRGALASALYVADDIVATEVGFVQNGTYLSYIGAFDWAMRDYSVGKLQIEEALKWSLENNITTYDFLGEPSVYKSDWSNDEVALYSCHHGITMKGIAYATIWQKNMRPFVKKCFHKIPINLRKQIMTLLSQ